MTGTGGHVPTPAVRRLLRAVADGDVTRHRTGRGHDDRYRNGEPVVPQTLARLGACGWAIPGEPWTLTDAGRDALDRR